jgi:hypothetical protein
MLHGSVVGTGHIRWIPYRAQKSRLFDHVGCVEGEVIINPKSEHQRSLHIPVRKIANPSPLVQYLKAYVVISICVPRRHRTEEFGHVAEMRLRSATDYHM